MTIPKEEEEENKMSDFICYCKQIVDSNRISDNLMWNNSI